MDKEELEYFKKKLLQLRAQHVGEIKHIERDYMGRPQREQAGDLSAYSHHIADRATDSYEMERQVEMLSSRSDILYEIEEALFRIKDGTYGVCERCGAYIPKERLEAIPYARLCIECKKRR
jgi:RNA polymerase-binding protein DksA